MAKQSIADRFWSKVNKTDTCWLWTRQLSTKGYGRFLYYSRSERSSRGMYAHRVSWIMANGPIPDGANVLHKCDTPACVNPEHLFLGTQSDNMQDCKRKGRTCNYNGENHPQARLTESDVRAIRSDTRTQSQIALAYGITRGFVNSIKKRHAWKHID